MKKVLSLVLTLVLLVSVVSVSFAAVTVSGNARLWYQNIADTSNDNNKKDLSTFKFDRLALDCNADFDKNSGFKSEVQFRSLRLDKGESDIRVDFAYLYQKGVLLTNDELDAGAFNSMPFKNGYGNAMISGGLGDGLKIGNSVGAIYTISDPSYTFAFGLCNALTNVSSNSKTDVGQTSPEGFDYALRFNYIPLSGLKVGLGYEQVNIVKSDNSVTINSGNDYYTAMVVDASYNDAKVPYSGMIEYATINPTEGGKSYDSLAGIYGEGVYNFGAFKVYAGRGISLTDPKNVTNPSPTFKKNIYTKAVNPYWTGGTNYYSVTNNYSTIGLTLPVNSNNTLQAEYVAVDDDSTVAIKGQSMFGVRLVTKF